ncbi:MAG TPA: GTP cyclohydrolase I [Candidatus Dormibacteraeota bacterium]|nr:GTP cyclohydrolase I [Candidatus Dormibacteraeota bacterium]
MSLPPPARHVVDWMEELFPDEPHVAAALRESIAERSDRIDRAYREILDGYRIDPARVLTFTREVGPGGYHGCVESREIPFMSICAHHFLPFFGTVDVTYWPGSHIVGLGKIPRLVQCRARRFQIQESLVQEIAHDMIDYGKARGVTVSATAKHLCVCYRGPNVAPVVNRTMYRLGETDGDA